MLQDKETGLILPDNIVREKHSETWPYAMIRKIRYAAKELSERDVDMMMVCKKCEKPLVFELSTGEVLCECKRRRVL